MGDCEEEAGQKKTRSRSVSPAAVLSVRPRMDILLANHEFPARPGAKDLPKELRRGLPKVFFCPASSSQSIVGLREFRWDIINSSISIFPYYLTAASFFWRLPSSNGSPRDFGVWAGSLDNLTMVGEPGAGLVADLEEPPVLSLQPSRDSGGQSMNWRCEAGSLVPLRATRSASVSATSPVPGFPARTAYDLEPAHPRNRVPRLL